VMSTRVGLCVCGTSPMHIHYAMRAQAMPFWKHAFQTPAFSFGVGELRSQVHTIVGPAVGRTPSIAAFNLEAITRGDTLGFKGLEGFGSSSIASQDNKLVALQNSGKRVLCLAQSRAVIEFLGAELESTQVLENGIEEMGQVILEHVQKQDFDLILGITDDVLQHSFHSSSQECIAFYAQLDSLLQKLADSKLADFVVTSSHGMNEKKSFDGKLKVIDLEEILARQSISGKVKIVSDSNDSYHAHSSCAFIHLEDKNQLNQCLSHLRSLPGVYAALGAQDASRGLEIPPELLGDIVLLGDQSTLFGASISCHQSLQNHGGLDEQTVPFLYHCSSESGIKKEYRDIVTKGKVRNHSMLDFLLQSIP